LPEFRSSLRGIAIVAAGVALTAAFARPLQAASGDGADRPRYPTTEFAEGARSASVSAGDITAGVAEKRLPKIARDSDVPVLEVIVGGRRVLEAPGVASGSDQPLAQASIAEIDPGNQSKEVYFTSFSGGAHCCSNVIVAEAIGDKWVAVPIGDFDGDGDFLDDLDKDGVAEIVTVDNRFLYQFDCYACSAAPLVIRTVRDGKAVDVTSDARYRKAHRDWLKQMEDEIDPAQRWSSPGFLAGWVAERARLGEGAAALKELDARWNLAKDEGEEVCLTGGEPENCARKNRTILKFPERLKLFLKQSGYLP
jgi:hypothetical protein